MNKAEEKAKEIYARNRLKVLAYGRHLSSSELCIIAKAQDRLYYAINSRQDAAYFKKL